MRGSACAGTPSPHHVGLRPSRERDGRAPGVSTRRQQDHGGPREDLEDGSSRPQRPAPNWTETSCVAVARATQQGQESPHPAWPCPGSARPDHSLQHRAPSEPAGAPPPDRPWPGALCEGLSPRPRKQTCRLTPPAHCFMRRALTVMASPLARACWLPACGSNTPGGPVPGTCRDSLPAQKAPRPGVPMLSPYLCRLGPC